MIVPHCSLSTVFLSRVTHYPLQLLQPKFTYSLSLGKIRGGSVYFLSFFKTLAHSSIQHSKRTVKMNLLNSHEGPSPFANFLMDQFHSKVPTLLVLARSKSYTEHSPCFKKNTVKNWADWSCSIRLNFELPLDSPASQGLAPFSGKQQKRLPHSHFWTVLCLYSAFWFSQGFHQTQFEVLAEV